MTLLERLPTLTWPPPWLLPWHMPLGLAVLFLLGLVISRLQRERAREDCGDAFFYSPSSRTRQRQRRQIWQDRVWAARRDPVRTRERREQTPDCAPRRALAGLARSRLPPRA